MKAKKLLALGLLTALAVTSMTGTGVSAAESAAGATNVSYKPGAAIGEGDDGSVADWTIDYPIKVVLDDSTKDKNSAKVLTFNIYDTGTEDAYTGDSTITATSRKYAAPSAEGDGTEFKLLAEEDAGSFFDEYDPDDLKGSLAPKTDYTVHMKLENEDGALKAIEDTEFGELNSSNNSVDVYAYLSKKENTQKDTTYIGKLLWSFSSNN